MTQSQEKNPSIKTDSYLRMTDLVNRAFFSDSYYKLEIKKNRNI